MYISITWNNERYLVTISWGGYISKTHRFTSPERAYKRIRLYMLDGHRLASSVDQAWVTQLEQEIYYNKHQNKV